MGTRRSPGRRTLSRIVIAGAAVLALAVVAAGPVAADPGKVMPQVVSVGSHYDIEPDVSGFAAEMAYCSEAKSTAPSIHTYEWAQFQDDFASYLAGSPETVATWFGGHRMQFYAAQGLLTPIPVVWHQIGQNYSPAMQALSTTSDGQPYFVPQFTYPWVVLYDKSVFAEHGYTVPQTFDEFMALAEQMESDGLVPLSFGDADGWEAMGLFDILDMRLNGFDFHMGLMAGTESWTDTRVQAVFEQWKSLLPLTSPDPMDRGWREAASDLSSGVAGMTFLGTFASLAIDEAVLPNIDMFPFPVFGNAYDVELAIDAPVDGMVMTTSTANFSAARRLLACAGSPAAQLQFLAHDNSMIAAARTADTSSYTPYQQRMASVVNSAGHIAQFMDRDMRPDFAGPEGMQAFLADFVVNPDQDLVQYLSGIQAAWDALPPE
jgi:multiple sugar transport system substrate-binding protein